MISADLLSIGSELLLGETVDTNAAFLGGELAALGIPLRSVRMLGDDRAAIGDAFTEARARSALVLATGGLGPTSLARGWPTRSARPWPRIRIWSPSWRSVFVRSDRCPPPTGARRR